MNPIVCVRHDALDTMGLAPSALADGGARVHVVDAWTGSPAWPSLGTIAGLVVFGGDMHVDEIGRHPNLLQERRLVRQAAERGVPVLGVCLGGQMLARAMGARVRAGVTREFGFYPLHPTEEGARDGLLSVFAPGDPVFQWHRDAFDLPAGATLLARSEPTRNQAYRIGERAWGIQFHPEVDERVLEGYFAQDPQGIEREWGRRLREVRAEIRDHLAAANERGRALFSRFARLCADGSRRAD